MCLARAMSLFASRRQLEPVDSDEVIAALGVLAREGDAQGVCVPPSRVAVPSGTISGVHHRGEGLVQVDRLCPAVCRREQAARCRSRPPS